MAEYPQDRDAFFAHKVVRLMLRTCAAQELGSDGCLLVTAIAHTEDAKRYTDAATYWNHQLQSVLNLSWDKLNRARKRAVRGGWLHYETGGKGKVGRYWSLVPPRFAELTDTAVDEDDPVILRALAEERRLSSAPVQTEAGDKSISPRIGTETSLGEAWEKLGRSSNHSSLRPKPKPKPEDIKLRTERAQHFREFWGIYPPRNGRQLGKAQAEAEFAKLKDTDVPLVLQAARHVKQAAETGTLPKDAFRWLRKPRRGKGDEPWREWVEPPTENGSVGFDITQEGLTE